MTQPPRLMRRLPNHFPHPLIRLPLHKPQHKRLPRKIRQSIRRIQNPLHLIRILHHLLHRPLLRRHLAQLHLDPTSSSPIHRQIDCRPPHISRRVLDAQPRPHPHEQFLKQILRNIPAQRQPKQQPMNRLPILLQNLPNRLLQPNDIDAHPHPRARKIYPAPSNRCRPQQNHHLPKEPGRPRPDFLHRPKPPDASPSTTAFNCNFNTSTFFAVKNIAAPVSSPTGP
jgi:hypothetical protein